MTHKHSDALSDATYLKDYSRSKSWVCDGSLSLKGWTVEHTVQPPDGIEIAPLLDHALVITLSGNSDRQITRLANEEYDGTGHGNHFFIMPSGANGEFVWDGTDEAMNFDFSPQSLRRTAIETESINPVNVELKPLVFGQDEQIIRFARLLRHEIRTGGEGNRIYAESLLTAFNIHLLRHYCTFEAKLKDYASGLAPHRLHEVLEYIDSNLADGNPSLSAMAKIANLSSYYFARQFKHSTGLPPHQYVMMQRIERAKRLLKQPQLSVAQVGLACGFSNQSHFGRVFREATGTTPKRYRRGL